MRLIQKPAPQLLYPNPAWDSFVSIPLKDPNALIKAKEQLKGISYPRSSLYQILKSYNREIGNDSFALQQIERIQLEDSYCIVTGQQLGLMGGPAYTILKAITCLQVARAANAIPIFWLATEDHDISEIDHTFLIDGLGNLKEFRLNFPRDGTPVEDLFLSEKCVETIHAFLEVIKKPELKQFAVIGDRYASAMAALLARLFSGTGLVLMEPRLLRSLAIPFFKREVIEAEGIFNTIQKTTERFKQAGGNPPVIPAATNLFYKVAGKLRAKVRWDGSQFKIGSSSYSLAEMLTLIEHQPDYFSTNVLARPLLQSQLLPTLAYVAGPHEWLYYHQLKDYYQFCKIPMPWITERLSTTLLSPYVQELLEKSQLNPWEPIPHHWHELLPEVDQGVADLSLEWQSIAKLHFGKEVEESTLSRYIRHPVNKIQKKITTARLKKRGLPYSALHYLNNWLHPHHQPQERVLNWWGFQTQAKENLIHAFQKEPIFPYEGHYYCYT